MPGTCCNEPHKADLDRYMVQGKGSSGNLLTTFGWHKEEVQLAISLLPLAGYKEEVQRVVSLLPLALFLKPFLVSKTTLSIVETFLVLGTTAALDLAALLEYCMKCP